MNPSIIKTSVAIEGEAQGDEDKFRLEARNVSAFLSVRMIQKS